MPKSLNVIGLALGSGVIIAALQWVETPDYDATVSAYGIVTRLITFAFLPLLGLAHAMQTITGNNYGASACRRSDARLRTAVLAAFGCCFNRRIAMTAFAAPIGSDPVVIAELARPPPVISAGSFAAGPPMMIATYVQAIGDAGRATILGPSKPNVFAMPLTYRLAGGWASPSSGRRRLWPRSYSSG